METLEDDDIAGLANGEGRTGETLDDEHVGSCMEVEASTVYCLIVGISVVEDSEEALDSSDSLLSSSSVKTFK